PEEVYGRPATRWVAEFLGDADVVPGTAADGVADCELGRFPADRALRGPVGIVLRPEGVVIGPDGADVPADDPADGTAEARVVSRSYFGHDQLVQLQLASGLRLRSRIPGSAAWQPGDLVRVQVTGPVTVLGLT
ncbi:MAG: TOBE domain-containing protein, partial [Actinomycetota bacterium]|nr:TOBE domain-containing protein [Actinomycetota bacterium]